MIKIPKFSLSGLMGAIALIALAIAAYRIPWSPLRTSAYFTIVVFLLLTATLGGLLNRRASWVGFSLFGWFWLVISFLALEVGSKQSTADAIPVPMPITSLWLVEFSSSVLGFEPSGAGEPVTIILNSKGGHSLVSHSLVQTCNFANCLIAACLGAWLGWWFERRESRRPSGGARGNGAVPRNGS